MFGICLFYGTESARSQPAPAQPAQPSASPELIFGMHSPDLAAFEENAKLAKKLGATHMVVTDDLPWASWQLDLAKDPYPAWFIYRPGLLKLFPPKELQPYVDVKYAEQAVEALEARCGILRKYGLRGYYETNEPQTLPEAFFVAHPDLRGPRVDQANRSRTAYFAPCVDQPETLRMYREAMQSLLKRCPEIDIFHFVTTDAGSGFCWAPALYPGMNGSSLCKDRPMADRVAGFLINLQKAALDDGHHIEINIREIPPRPWMLPTFNSPIDIAHHLPAGLAVDDLEGPNGRTFVTSGGIGPRFTTFYPLLGIPQPARFLSSLPESCARRLVYFDDYTQVGFYAGLFELSGGKPPVNVADKWVLLQKYAVQLAGDADANDLLAIWDDTDRIGQRLDGLEFGSMIVMGHLLNRWFVRPMVPFPMELKKSDKDYYRPFILQAKGEKEADDLADIQAMDMFKGWGAKLLFSRTLLGIEPLIKNAVERAGHLAADPAVDKDKRARWELLAARLQALRYLFHSAENMISYQAQLDRVKNLGIAPETDPVLGTQGSWDRANLMETARKEIDNSVVLMRLLQSGKAPIFDTAKTPEAETIMLLGPDLTGELRHKIDIMNAHWEDYGRLFTIPNP